MKKFKEKLGDFKDIFLFAVIITGFHVLFKVAEPAITSNVLVKDILDLLVSNLLSACSGILDLLGINNTTCKDVICLPGGFSIQIQYGCSGFQQFLLIIALFLLFPGSWRKKAWFIPAALAGLHFLNIARLVALCIYFSYHHLHFHFIHDWIFRPFIYFVIFISWVVWVEINKEGKKIKNPG
jgi:exosortase/archaeosortase family protein